MQSNSNEVSRILNEAIPIPGQTWLFHPAVPVNLIRRHPVAQRESQLLRLMKKAGELDEDKLGVVRISPGGDKFWAITGATRVEWMQKEGRETVPAQVYPIEMTEAQMSKGLLDEATSIALSAAVKQEKGEVAGDKDALLIKRIREEILPGVAAIGEFYVILRKDGEEFLIKVAEELRRTWPQETHTIPAPVIGGMAVLLRSGGVVAAKFRSRRKDGRNTPLRLWSEARRVTKGPLRKTIARMLSGEK